MINKTSSKIEYSWRDTVKSSKEYDLKNEKDSRVMSIIGDNLYENKVLIRTIDHSDLIYLYEEESGKLISINTCYNVEYIDEIGGDFEI